MPATIFDLTARIDIVKSRHCQNEGVFEDAGSGVVVDNGHEHGTTDSTATLTDARDTYSHVSASSMKQEQQHGGDRSNDMSLPSYTNSALYDGRLTITTPGTRTVDTGTTTASTAMSHACVVARGAEDNKNTMLVMQQQLQEKQESEVDVEQVDTIRQQYHHFNNILINPMLLPDAGNMPMNDAHVVITK